MNNLMNNIDEALVVPTSLIPMDEAADLLGMSTRWLREERRARRIGYIQVDRRIFFTEKHLRDYVNYRRTRLTANEVPAIIPGQLELDFEIAADEVPASTTHQSPVGTQLAA